MPENFVFELAKSARETIAEGYYDNLRDGGFPRRSLLAGVKACSGTPVIAEVKFRSPAEGALRSHDDVAEIAGAYQRGGVVGISVLTEPRHFEGSLDYLTQVKRSVTVPVLMKDIFIDPLQIDAAEKVGADVVLLMASIFDNSLSDYSLDRMTRHAHDKRLEVLLEAHTDGEYRMALDSGADLVGINNRDLDTLQVSLDTSRALLGKGYDKHSKPVISESGISRRSEVIELRSLGADGFLVGSALMKSKDIEGSVRSLRGE